MANGNSFQKDLETKLIDADFAAEYLAAALDEDDDEFLINALANVVKIHGVTQVSNDSGIARQAIYKMLSNEGNPSFKNVSRLLDAVGFELTIKKKDAS